ncbi:MAG: methyltransferase domain-containing protein, partial [Gammaproteobacteria bacterium]|nr:methyltransferase domain-containing protein [Gammaproteobacteria bacterium]
MSDAGKEIFYKDQLVQSFNQAAADYERHATLQKYTADELIDRVQVMNIQPGAILDLGSGTGGVSSRLAELFANTLIVQADISLCMLQKARGLQGQTKHRWSYLCGDAEHLPFEKNAFDLVVSNLMLQWGEDLKKIFDNVVAMLKP